MFLLRMIALPLLAVCILLVAAAPRAEAQDSAQSNATFWLQERARSEHPRPSSARQAPRVRRLVPNKRLARPTIWRGPGHKSEDGAVPPVDGAPSPAPVDQATPQSPTTPEQAQPATPPQSPATADATKETPAPQQPPAAAPPAAVAEPASKMTVAVVGDNLGYMLAQGMTDTEADGTASGALGLAVMRKTKDSSGLVRDDFYDWQKNLREILAAPEPIGAVAVMIGSNDRQELRDAAGRYEPLSPHWKDIYKTRVDALIAQIKAKGVPLFWVGMPPMRAERYSSDLAQINEIYRASVEAAGGKFIDIWDAFADEKGRFSVFGPDVTGQIVKLRTSDGVHFTKAGQRKLAYFAEQAMRGLVERARPSPDAAIAALPPPSLQPPPQIAPGAPIAAPPGPAAPAAKPAAPQAIAPPPPPPPPKPEFGPIVPLTAPPVALNGELLGPADAAARKPQARAAISAESVAGRVPTAPKNRADDFSWPRR